MGYMTINDTLRVSDILGSGGPLSYDLDQDNQDDIIFSYRNNNLPLTFGK